MKVSWKMTRKMRATRTGVSAMSWTRCFGALLAVLLLSCLVAAAQTPKPKKGEPRTRTLMGIVSLPDGKPATRAVVLLENTKTKAIISCYTQPDGSYVFRELNPDVDYRVNARLEDAVSPSRNLGAFDARTEAVINLKLEKK